MCAWCSKLYFAQGTFDFHQCQVPLLNALDCWMSYCIMILVAASALYLEPINKQGLESAAFFWGVRSLVLCCKNWVCSFLPRQLHDLDWLGLLAYPVERDNCRCWAWHRTNCWMTASGRKHYENWGKCILCFARSDKETSSPNLCKSVAGLEIIWSLQSHETS